MAERESRGNRRTIQVGNTRFEDAELAGEVYFTRHGVAKQKPEGGSIDVLDDESGTVSRLAEAGKRYRLQDKLSPEDVVIIHSPLDRTLRTALAVTAGALNFEQKPSKVSDLEGLAEKYRGVAIQMEPELGYAHLGMDAKALKKHGTTNYVNYQLQNPFAKTMGLEGKVDKEDKKSKDKEKKSEKSEKKDKKEDNKITPGTHMLGMGDLIVLQAAQYIMNEDPSQRRKYIVVASHGSILEFPVVAAINSTLDRPLTDLNEIGGEFHMEDSATMAIYRVKHEGKEGYVVTIRRNSLKGKPIEKPREYLVDLNRVDADLQDRVNNKEYDPQLSRRHLQGKESKDGRGHQEQHLNQQAQKPRSLRPERPYEPPPLSREPVGRHA